MYRTVFIPGNESELVVRLPEEYLQKQVEVIAFEVEDFNHSQNQAVRDEVIKSAFAVFDSMRVPTKGYSFDREVKRDRIIKVIDNLPGVDFKDYKFNRDEANER